jgi:hypothetical protein
LIAGNIYSSVRKKETSVDLVQSGFPTSHHLGGGVEVEVPDNGSIFREVVVTLLLRHDEVALVANSKSILRLWVGFCFWQIEMDDSSKEKQRL